MTTKLLAPGWREGVTTGVSFWRAIRETLREMAPPVRRSFRFWMRFYGSLFGFFALLSLTLPLVRGPNWLVDFVSLQLKFAGGLGFIVLEALMAISNARGRSWLPTTSREWFRPNSEVRFHRLQLAFPFLAVAVAVCLGAGFALSVVDLIRSVSSAGRVWLEVLIGAFLLGTLMYRVAVNSRFVYRHALEQSEAKLALLQSQLQPHYLFNALNTVAALVRKNPEAAEAAVENVARVLRRTLDRSRRGLAPLAEEIDYLEAYLAIEQQRWGDRLRLVWQIPGATQSALVPPLVLQPLVENALKHGLSERLESGTLTIGAALAGDGLELWVEDDGVGPVRGWKEGTGLGNLRERLVSVYGPEATLELREARPGTRVVVRLPLDGMENRVG